MTTMLLVAILSAMYLGLISPSAAAQGRNNSSSNRSSSSKAIRTRELQDRSVALDHIGDTRNIERPPISKLAYAEIREDFVRVQEINNQLLEAASKSLPGGPEPIQKAAAEINKRAERLKTNLILPPPRGEADKNRPDVVVGQTDLLSQIRDLDAHITAFVTNPMFVNPQVLDREQSAIASVSLEKVLSASRLLRQSADKVRKQAAHK